jgi:hypothetical protein
MTRSMSHSRRLAAALALAAVSLGLMGAGPSLADSRVNGDGVGVSFQSRGEKFRIWDNGCDGHRVYVLYRLERPGGGFGEHRRLDYDGGCRTMGLFRLTIDEGRDIVWNACVDIQFGRDRCSFDTLDEA